PAVSTREVLGRLLRRLPSYALALVFSRLIIALGALLFLLLLPSAYARCLFTSEVSLLERASPGESIVRSARLIKRHLGPALGLLLAIPSAMLMFTLPAVGLGEAVVGCGMQLGEPCGSLAEQGVSPYALAGFFTAVPYIATARFFHYIDLRTRKEGWDIQLKFRAIAAAEATAARH